MLTFILGLLGAALGAYAEFIADSIGHFVATGGGSLWAWIVAAAFLMSAYVMLKRTVTNHALAALAIGLALGYLSGTGLNWSLPLPP
jgi:hypothetical protein